MVTVDMPPGKRAWPLRSSQRELFERGAVLVGGFQAATGMRPPAKVQAEDGRWRVNACGYYRPDEGVRLCLPLCARPGVWGRAWSWPGYVVDRTPYGVVCHEMGHHVDHTLSSPHSRDRYRGDYSRKMRAAVREDPITTYCPDDGEWFAEVFRLFLTNPNLLANIRPRAYLALAMDFKAWDGSRQQQDWGTVLTANEAPERYFNAAANKVAAVARARPLR